jgi:hypothetical protein
MVPQLLPMQVHGRGAQRQRLRPIRRDAKLPRLCYPLAVSNDLRQRKVSIENCHGVVDEVSSKAVLKEKTHCSNDEYNIGFD